MESQILLESDNSSNISLFELPEDVTSLAFCQQIVSGNDVADWAGRIEARFSKESDWHVLQIKQGEQAIGFFLISQNPDKLVVWNQKFRQKGWTQTHLNVDHSAQFAYFFIHPDHRQKGYGEKAMGELFQWCQQKNISTLYGFTRDERSRSLHLYQKTGCVILGRDANIPHPGTYFRWQLGQ